MSKQFDDERGQRSEASFQTNKMMMMNKTNSTLNDSTYESSSSIRESSSLHHDDDGMENEEEKEEDQEISMSNNNDDDDRQNLTWNEKMVILLQNFSQEQFSRYEMCRRSKFSKSIIKKLIRSITNVTINDRTAIALAGIAKVYVGQLIETGKLKTINR
uniref:Transcription initiation factor TFIID subunit 11-like n=1 Tax=Dermatophagoides pteronyssinus TaxID=6956 RepID=A0A6P6XPX4_DERPT|nr:transcription initiation factor TFIID subunit 11-like [Dermatophagoides pteronyssinus]